MVKTVPAVPGGAEAAKRFSSDPLEFLLSCRRTHGPIARVRFGMTNYYMVFCPNLLRDLFGRRDLGRSAFSATFEPVAKGSMILNEGEQWSRQRAALAPFFRRENLRSELPRMAAAADSLLDEVASARAGQGEFDAQDLVTRFAMRVLSTLLLGECPAPQVEGALADAWTRALRAISAKVAAPLPLPYWMPSPNNRAVLAAAADIRRLFDGLVAGYLARPHGRGFLGYLSTWREPGASRGLSPVEIRNELMGLYLAGFDTIAMSMLWMLGDLAERPELQEAVRRELNAAPATSWGLTELPLFRRAFSESLRLRPPLFLIDRRTTVPTPLGDYVLPADAAVLISPYVTHRDPDHWEDPSRFDPDRFLPDAAAARHPFAYIPYGGGPMACIGGSLAAIEARMLVGGILTRMTLSLSPLRRVTEDTALVLRPRHGLYLSSSLCKGEARA